MIRPRNPLRWSVLVITLALLAGCTSGGSSSRSASGSAGDPTKLPALPRGTGGTQLVPTYVGTEITPSTWVSTSLTPTLVVPDVRGAWTFTIDDLSDGKSGFGPRTYTEAGSTSRLPLGAGLQQGRVYVWSAQSPGQQPVGGTFQVDVQMAAAQETDTVDGLTVNLSSGETSFSWSSHSMAAVAGKVGFGLAYQGSNITMPGVPVGWTMQAASSSQYRRLLFNPDQSVSLVADNGLVSSYRQGVAGAFLPVQLSGGSLDTNGLSPVLLRDGAGNYTVTTKDTTSVFAPTADGTAAELVSVSAGDRPVLNQESKDGRVAAVVDPVSGRKVEFVYGGGDCGATSPGFVAAPTGMLCRAKFWDGSTASVQYVAGPDGVPTIGRLVDFPEAAAGGAQVTDLAFDSVGHIVTVRSPLVAAAAASGIVGVEDPQFWTSATYDDRGRVASITESASAIGATRCVRSYVYESLKYTVVQDSCFGGVVGTTLFDPTTFFPLVLTNSAGQTARRVWDLPTGQLLAEEDFTGLVTTRRYEDGQLVETRGPTRGSIAESAAVIRTYDQSFDRADTGLTMYGLDVTYWPSTTDLGRNGVQELGPRLGGQLVNSLTVNWPSSPAGNNGGWSALMTGSLKIDVAGTYSFRSNNSIAVLRVNNVLCADGGCDDMRLQPGYQSIRLDLTSPNPQASMDIAWTGPDAGVGGALPLDRLRPQYGYATTTRVVDPNVRGASSETVSRTAYDNPANGLVSSRTTKAGSRTTMSYETGTGGKGGWGRQVSSTSPGGNQYRFTYWGDRESAKSSCPGATSVNQGGLPKQTISPGPDGGDGPSTQQWMDGAGRAVAMALSSGATVCTTFDKAGRVARTELLGMGTTEIETNDFAVDGNPLRRSLTSTIGTDVGTTLTEVDLRGRPVRVVDRWGVESVTTYDVRTGEVATVSTTAPGAAPSVTSNTYDERGWLRSVAIDGRVVATLTMNGDGTTRSITYGNGVAATNSYDASNRLIAVAWSGPGGGSWANSLTISAANNVSSASYSAGGRSSTFTYVHDEGYRLVSSSVTAGLVPAAMEWTYGFDANTNRTSQRVTTDGVVTGDWTYAYDRADRLVSTTDPSAAEGIEYDVRGNATKVGPDRFTFDAADRLVGATDGTTSVTYQREVSGGIVAKTTVGGPDAGIIRFGLGGIMLDGESRPTTRVTRIPGGVSLQQPITGTGARWEFPSIDGDRFFVTDDAGAQVGSVQVYDPFGQLLSAPLPTDPTVPILGWQAVTGNETQSMRTTFVLMGTRVYIPALGRFIQLDPKVGGSANGYDYAAQDPVNITDPSGKSFSDWLPTIVVGVVSMVVSIFATPAAGFAVAAAINAVIGAASYAAIYLWEKYGQKKDTEFSLKDMGMSALLSGVMGGIGGRTQWTKALKSAKALGASDETVSRMSTLYVARNAKSLNRAAEFLKAATVAGTDDVAGISSNAFRAFDKSFVTKSRVAAVSKLWNGSAPSGSTLGPGSWEGVSGLYWRYGNANPGLALFN